MVESKLQRRLNKNLELDEFEATIFDEDRKYDVVVPLPNSTGPGASRSNLEMTKAIASVFYNSADINGGDSGS